MGLALLGAALGSACSPATTATPAPTAEFRPAGFTAEAREALRADMERHEGLRDAAASDLRRLAARLERTRELARHQRLGVPYRVAGRTYVPAHRPLYSRVGVASWYGDRFHGRPTAQGEPFDMLAMTAAHKTLPLGSRVRVTDLRSGRSIEVRINDRGPFIDGRIIDLSWAAARELRLGRSGKGRNAVRVDYLGPAARRPDTRPAEAVEAERGILLADLDGLMWLDDPVVKVASDAPEDEGPDSPEL